MENGISRASLVAREWVLDYPMVDRKHNRHRKDTKLTPEQQETLKENYGLDSRVTSKMTENDILVVLRKKHKNYKFNQIKFN